MNKRRERIERFKGNAEYQRKQGDLQGCLEFKELAEELEKLERIEKIVNDWKNGDIEGQDTIGAFHLILEVLENE